MSTIAGHPFVGLLKAQCVQDILQKAHPAAVFLPTAMTQEPLSTMEFSDHLAFETSHPSLLLSASGHILELDADRKCVEFGGGASVRILREESWPLRSPVRVFFIDLPLSSPSVPPTLQEKDCFAAWPPVSDAAAAQAHEGLLRLAPGLEKAQGQAVDQFKKCYAVMPDGVEDAAATIRGMAVRLAAEHAENLPQRQAQIQTLIEWGLWRALTPSIWIVVRKGHGARDDFLQNSRTLASNCARRATLCPRELRHVSLSQASRTLTLLNAAETPQAKAVLLVEALGHVYADLAAAMAQAPGIDQIFGREGPAADGPAQQGGASDLVALFAAAVLKSDMAHVASTAVVLLAWSLAASTQSDAKENPEDISKQTEAVSILCSATAFIESHFLLAAEDTNVV